MSFEDYVGEISFSSKGVHWTIPNFSQLPQIHNTITGSPSFQFENRQWCLFIHPNGLSFDPSFDWFGMVAWCKTPFTADECEIHLGITDKHGRSIVSCRAEWDGCFDYNCMKLISNGEFKSRKSEFMPDGTLHVLFTIVNKEEGEVCKIKQDLEKMLLNEIFTDVVLTVHGQEFKAHRNILAARSPVFSAMFSHDMKEKATGVINIEDGDPNTVPDFLHFLYTEKVNNFTSEKALKLYYIADKYQICDLKQKCKDQLLRNISVENFCEIITLSVQHNETQLKDACIQFFRENSLDIDMIANWQTLLSENPIIVNELFI